MLALAACGGRNGGGTAGGGPVGNQGEPAAPAFVGSLPVDLVALDMTTLVFVRVAADGVRELRRLEMPDAIEQVAWASPDELYVRLADGGVQVVRGGEAAAVALPPDEAWQVPNPQPGGDLEPLARDELRIDPDGGAWLGRCQWGIPYDAGYCEVWTWARLVPGATVGTEAPATREPTPWRLGPPPGVELSLVPSRAGDRDEPVDLMRCQSGGVSAEYPDPDGRADPDFYGMELGRWLAHDPPIYLAARLEPGFDAYSEDWHLFLACEPTPMAAHVNYELGPAGVWAFSSEGEPWKIQVEGREVGQLPGELYSLTFAPPRP
ncbi:MAG: hypothetical protein H6708_21545 [Kofleriaceae bacterium]|nr:hypothetical protein [Kofleriaceae bacterium]